MKVDVRPQAYGVTYAFTTTLFHRRLTSARSPFCAEFYWTHGEVQLRHVLLVHSCPFCFDHGLFFDGAAGLCGGALRGKARPFGGRALLCPHYQYLRALMEVWKATWLRPSRGELVRMARLVWLHVAADTGFKGGGGVGFGEEEGGGVVTSLSPNWKLVWGLGFPPSPT